MCVGGTGSGCVYWLLCVDLSGDVWVCRKNLLPEKFDLDRDFSKTKEIQPGSYDGGRGTTNDITDPKERKRARVK